jgi:hypothetical protein
MNDKQKGLVFVSCGQITDAEKQLGHDVCALVQELTPHSAYFAQQQSNLEGLTKNILGALDQAVGIIAIMHPRGIVHFTDDVGELHQHGRSSIWIEQEIAIAAYITQVAKQPLRIAAFVHSDVEREGMREHLHLNPIPFRHDSEVLEHLRGILADWNDILPRIAGDELSQVMMRTTISYLGPQNILLDCANDSNEKITIESFVLEYDGIALTAPLTSKGQGQWIIDPGIELPVNATFFNDPMGTLIDFHRNTGLPFDANVNTVLRCKIRGRFKEFSGRHRIRCNGVQHIQVLGPK